MVKFKKEIAGMGGARYKRAKIASKVKPNKKSEKSHPIEQAVNSLVHGVIDIRFCSSSFLPVAKSSLNDEVEACVADMKQIATDIEKGGLEARETKNLLGAVRRLRRVALSKAPQVLQESLFIYLFSALDFFIGELVTALFQQRENLYSALDRSIKFTELLDLNDVGAVKRHVLDNEIENLRRQSYSDQFKWLEKFYSISLTKWEAWPAFIEASQRRNLYVHCNGIVSDQYISVCESADFKFGQKKPEVGKRLQLTDDYFLASTELVMDAGIFLAHTLWRKVLPYELEQADTSLNNLIYDFLKTEAWSDAVRVAKFTNSQRESSSDLNRKIATVNLAIGYKFSGSTKFKSVMDKVDWSSSLPEFKLARDILNDKFEVAASTMRLIGVRGELITEFAYHDWPLFHVFRESQPFLTAYQDVYGRPFSVRAEKVVEDAALELRSQVQRKEVEES